MQIDFCTCPKPKLDEVGDSEKKEALGFTSDGFIFIFKAAGKDFV